MTEDGKKEHMSKWFKVAQISRQCIIDSAADDGSENYEKIIKLAESMSDADMQKIADELYDKCYECFDGGLAEVVSEKYGVV